MSEDGCCPSSHVDLIRVIDREGILHWGFFRSHDHSFSELVVLQHNGEAFKFRRDIGRTEELRNLGLLPEENLAPSVLSWGDGRFRLALASKRPERGSFS